MPKFTITADAGDGPDTLEDHLEFPSPSAAAQDAKLALTEMAREQISTAEKAQLAVAIKDEAGQQIYRARLNFEAEASEEIKRS